MTDKNVLNKEVKGHIALLTMNRPANSNALSRSLFLELTRAMEELERDENIRVIVLTGSGDKAFCAGVDLKERASLAESEILLDRTNLVKPCFDTLRRVTKPMIAAVNGVALGGGAEIALACDIRIAADTARFGQTEIKWGIIPAAGAHQRLRMIAGIGRAKELIFTGRILDAEEAFQMGIYNRVVQPEILMEKTMELASTIAKNSPIALRQAKRAIDVGAHTAEAFEFEFEVSKECYFAGKGLTAAKEF